MADSGHSLVVAGAPVANGLGWAGQSDRSGEDRRHWSRRRSLRRRDPGVVLHLANAPTLGPFVQGAEWCRSSDAASAAQPGREADGATVAPNNFAPHAAAPQLTPCTLDRSTNGVRVTAPECAYCGGLATTEDHIPPQSLLPGVPRKKRPSVPSCGDCNHGASDDDEYFRDVVLKYHRVADKPEASSAVDAMVRAMGHPRKVGYAQAVL